MAQLGTEVEHRMPSSSKAALPPNEDADNPLYKEDNFRMWCLKVLPCSKRYCHDWTTCPWAHAQEKAKRRDPRVFNYTGVACPEMKKSMQCPRGDQCPYAHNVFEYWLHHSRYRTQLCNDGVGCKRKICFFAHTLDELRVSSVKVQVPEGFRGEINSTAINPFAPSHNNAPSPKQHHHAGMSQNGGNSSYSGTGSRGAPPSANSAAGGLSAAEMQQLGALQAKLQASQQMQQFQGLGPGTPSQQDMGAPNGDQAAIDQLVQLMLLSQQPQAQQPQQPGDPMQHLMAQMMMGQQQHQQQQSAAAMQVQQQMAALQLINQMQGMGRFSPETYPGMQGMSMPQEMTGQQQQRYNNAQSVQNRGVSYPGQGHSMPHSRSPSGLPHSYGDREHSPSEMRASMSASVDELARQLSGLSKCGSGKQQYPPTLMTSGGPGGFSDGPGSARSFRSGDKQGSARLARQHTHDGVGLSASLGIKQGDLHGMAGGNRGHQLASSAGVNGGRSALLQHTSPISVSALQDGYATTATSHGFSASHSTTSSHDESDLLGSHH